MGPRGRPSSGSNKPKECVGVSAFAFQVCVCVCGVITRCIRMCGHDSHILHIVLQGTNAHLLLARAPPSAPAVGGPTQLEAEAPPYALPWQRGRHWVAAEAHALVASVSTTSASARHRHHHRSIALTPGGRGVLLFQVQLGRPAAAYLWEHVVAGRPVCPAAAFLEVAAASTRLAVDHSQLPPHPASRLHGATLGPAASAQATVAVAVLQGVEIPSPLLLGAAGGPRGGGGELVCRIDLHSGSVKLSSAPHQGRRLARQSRRHTGSRSRAATVSGGVVHLQARIAILLGSPLGADSAATAGPPGPARLLVQRLLASSATAAAAAAPTPPSAPSLAGLSGCTGDPSSCFHPAALDSTLQLGALPLLALDGGATMVPVGLGGLLVPLHARGSGASDSTTDAFAAAWTHHAAPAGSDRDALADYHLRLPGWEMPLALHGLRSSSVAPARKPGAAEKSRGVAVPPLETAAGSSSDGAPPLYEVVWCASGPADAALPPSHASGMDAEAEGRMELWAPSSSHGLGLPTSVTPLAVAAAAATALALAQAYSSTFASGRIGCAQPRTLLPATGCTAAGPGFEAYAGPMLSAMLRCAALEVAGRDGRSSVGTPLGCASEEVRRQHAPVALSVPLRRGPFLPATLGEGLYGERISGAVQYVARLGPVTTQDSSSLSSAPGFRLVPRPPGSLNSLVPEPVPSASPAGQVAVRVHAVGLNFRDLLVVSSWSGQGSRSSWVG